MKIWNESETMKKLRNVIIKGKCELCEYNGSCYKGCHAIKYALHKNIFIPDCRCWYIPSDRESVAPPDGVLESMVPSVKGVQP